MMDMIECPICGHRFWDGENMMDADEIIGCVKEGRFMACHVCACDYNEADCIEMRGTLKTVDDVRPEEESEMPQTIDKNCSTCQVKDCQIMKEHPTVDSCNDYKGEDKE